MTDDNDEGENEKPWMRQAMQVVAGLILAGGALVGWKFCGLGDLISIIIGFCGLALVGKSFGEDWF